MLGSASAVVAVWAAAWPVPVCTSASVAAAAAASASSAVRAACNSCCSSGSEVLPCRRVTEPHSTAYSCGGSSSCSLHASSRQRKSLSLLPANGLGKSRVDAETAASSDAHPDSSIPSCSTRHLACRAMTACAALQSPSNGWQPCTSWIAAANASWLLPRWCGGLSNRPCVSQYVCRMGTARQHAALCCGWCCQALFQLTWQGLVSSCRFWRLAVLC